MKKMKGPDVLYSKDLRALAEILDKPQHRRFATPNSVGNALGHPKQGYTFAAKYVAALLSAGLIVEVGVGNQIALIPRVKFVSADELCG